MRTAKQKEHQKVLLVALVQLTVAFQMQATFKINPVQIHITKISTNQSINSLLLSLLKTYKLPKWSTYQTIIIIIIDRTSIIGISIRTRVCETSLIGMSCMIEHLVTMFRVN